MLYNERIRQFRQSKGYTQADFAEALGITQQQYFKYEKGTNELPIRYLIKLCECYNVSSDELLGLTKEGSGND